jgi:hypothetical protein
LSSLGLGRSCPTQPHRPSGYVVEHPQLAQARPKSRARLQLFPGLQSPSPGTLTGPEASLLRRRIGLLLDQADITVNCAANGSTPVTCGTSHRRAGGGQEGPLLFVSGPRGSLPTPPNPDIRARRSQLVAGHANPRCCSQPHI